MSGRTSAGGVLAAAGALLVLALGVTTPVAGQAAVPRPRATASATVIASPHPVASRSSDDDQDDPTDDGTNPMPDQTGTWVAIGGAVGLALLAALTVGLRKR